MTPQNKNIKPVDFNAFAKKHEDLILTCTDHEYLVSLGFEEGAKKMQELIDSQVDLDPEVVEIINKYFWDLL